VQKLIRAIVQRILGRGGLRRELALGALGSLSIMSGGKLFALGVAVLLARTLGPDGYGIYVFAMTLVTLVGMPATAGLPILLMREVAAYEVNGQWAYMKGLLLRANLMAGSFSLLILALAAVILMFSAERFDQDRLATYAWASLLLPVSVLAGLRHGALRGLRKVVLSQLPNAFVIPAVHGTILLAAWAILGLTAFTPALAMASMFVASTIGFVVGMFLLWRHLPRQLHTVRPAYELGRWLKSLPSLSALVGVSYINHHTDILMLGWLAGDESVGLYRVVTQIAIVVPFGLRVMNQVQGPHFSRMYAAGDLHRLQRLVTTTSRIALALALPAAALLILFGDAILALIFGTAYAAGHMALAILCVGSVVSTATGSVRMLANMTGHENDALKAFMWSAVLNVILNALLIPYFGIEGAAFATAVSVIVWNLVLVGRVRARTGISTTAVRWP
jgi:O-antigen/teichoic acid export membrane protein